MERRMVALFANTDEVERRTGRKRVRQTSDGTGTGGLGERQKIKRQILERTVCELDFN